MKRAISVVLALAMLVWSAPLTIIAAGQPDGVIAGTAVVEGNPLANIRVRLRNVDNGEIVGTMRTNARGEFRFTGLPIGNYVVETIADDDTLLGLSPKIALVAGAMVAGSVTVTTSAAAAAAAGAATGVAAAATGGFFASTAGIITVAALAAGVAAAAVAAQGDGSPSS